MAESKGRKIELKKSGLEKKGRTRKKKLEAEKAIKEPWQKNFKKVAAAEG